MSQAIPDLINQLSASLRTNLNLSLKAINSLNSGPTEPTYIYANMLWYDTGSNILKMKPEDNAAGQWISIGYLDQSTDTFKILDDTVVTTAAGVDTNGIIGDQATATWEAGTGTTESLVSPAKVKAAVEALAPTPTLSATQDTTSGSFVDFTGIPSTATEIDVYFIGYTNTGTSRVQFIVGGSVVTSGYYSSSGSSGAETGAKTDGFAIYNDGVTRQHNGIMSLRKAASGTWVESHSLTAGGAEVNGGGSATSIGNIDGIRVKATGVFQAGKISIRWK